MSRFDRIYRIHEMLRSASRPVPMRRFVDELESSRNTVTRDFEFLRDILGAPIIYCRESNGHQYDPIAPVFELPGFWMNSGELYALLACEQLLETVQPGLMTHHLAPLRDRIRKALGEAGHDAERINERIRLQPIHVRSISHQVFDPVAEATLANRQLRFTYISRSHSESKRRTVDPQRLLHYRSNWYLLAHCHSVHGLRLFSIDRISHPETLMGTSQCMPDNVLTEFSASSFGIFGGKSIAIAHLKFKERIAQWVAEEIWHPNQKGEWQKDGYHLWVPYSNSIELVMDILRYGPEVEVVEPKELRDEVAERVHGMWNIYW